MYIFVVNNIFTLNTSSNRYEQYIKKTRTSVITLIYVFSSFLESVLPISSEKYTHRLHRLV